jgi:AhpD family alkylhydroperoxidase
VFHFLPAPTTVQVRSPDKKNVPTKIRRVNKDGREQEAMVRRVNPFELKCEALKALIVFSASTCQSGLGINLVKLVQLRVSQIFGGKFCLDRYARDALAAGETEERLASLENWSNASVYSDREKAAFAWAEAVALAGQTQVPDAVYELASKRFRTDELVELTMVIGAVTAWNQIDLSFRLRKSE